MTDEMPRVRIVSEPESVPVYNCLIYLERTDDGVRGTIANLTNCVVTAALERDVLQKAVAEFKKIIGEHHSEGTDVPIVEPPEPGPGVTVRYVPVHL